MDLRRAVIALALLAGAARAQAAEIAGTLTADGKPVTGIAVAALAFEPIETRGPRMAAGEDPRPLATAITDAEGAFRLEGVGPAVLVSVRAPGHAPLLALAHEGAPAVLTLERAAMVRRTVLAGGRPVAGAVVVFFGASAGPQVTEWIARTAADGSFAVPDPDQWAQSVAIFHADFAPRFASPSPKWAARFALEAGAPVSGRVTDRATGRGVAGASIWIDGWPRGKSGADGSFAIAHESTEWTSAAARTSALAGTAKRSPGPIAIVLDPARTVDGVARDAAAQHPLPGVTVTIADSAQSSVATAVTDARGRYSVGGLASGRYWAYAARPGYETEGPDDEEDAVDLRRAGRLARDFALKPQRRLAGRVQDEQGRPVGAANVTFGLEGLGLLYGDMGKLWGDEQVMPSTLSGRDGAFTLAVPESLAGEFMRTANMRASVLAFKTGYAAGQAALPAAGSAVTLVLPRGHAIAGRVVGADGAPVADVAIAVAAMGPLFATQPLQSLPLPPWTRSDAEGRFSVQVNAGRHALAFRKDGHAPKAVDVADPAAAGALHVVLEPAAAVSGRVARADGRPLSGASVAARKPEAPDERVAAAATTDDEGGFVLSELEAGTYELTVAHEDGVHAKRTVQAPATGVRVDLAPAGSLRGRVVDVATRAPVPVFSVNVSRQPRPGEHDDFGNYRQEEIQAADGAFAIDGLPPGAVTVSVMAEGYRNRTIENVAVSGDPDAPALDVALEAGATLRGRVTADGAALPDASVWGGADAARTEAAATTDENGEYELKGLPHGAVTIHASKDGYQAARRTADAQPGARLDFALSRGLSLSGIVVAGDAPVAEAHVSARSSAHDAGAQSGTTDANGRFTLTGLSPGRYTVAASAPGNGRAKIEDLDVATAGNVRLVIDRSNRATVVGKVAGVSQAEGLPAMVMVSVTGAEDETAHAIADANGAFRIEDAPAGKVTVAGAAMVGSNTRSTAPVELTLAPGSETAVTLEFREDAVVSGTVFRDGAPLPGVRVGFQPAGAPFSEGSTARTDSAGRYQLGLGLGAYEVSVVGERTSYSTELEVKASATFDIDVTGGALRGRVVDAAGETPLSGVEVAVWAEGRNGSPADTATTTAEGTFEAPWLREGRYRVVTSKKGYGQQAADVGIARGETAEVRLALQAADGITLAVSDARDGRTLSAIVVVRDAAKRIVANRHAGADESGAVNIPLADGPYLVSASANGYGTATLRVTSPARGVAVALTPGGTLVVETARPLKGRIRLLQPDGEEYVQCWCNGIAEIKLEGRRTTVEHVTPGGYTLELAGANGESITRPLAIQEGQTTTVTID